MTKIVNIGLDFSRYPAGRRIAHGPFSGERFRNEFLLPHLLAGTKVEVRLDDTAGYGSSFLEEAFGGLVRSGVSLDQLSLLLDVKSNDQSLIDEIWTYIHRQGQRR